MENKRVCDCGSPADWEEIGSTWICTACRDKDIRRNIEELKDSLGKMEHAERILHMLKVDTTPFTDLLSRLKAEINRIKV
jgi:hypothetical protein